MKTLSQEPLEVWLHLLCTASQEQQGDPTVWPTCMCPEREGSASCPVPSQSCPGFPGTEGPGFLRSAGC